MTKYALVSSYRSNLRPLSTTQGDQSQWILKYLQSLESRKSSDIASEPQTFEPDLTGVVVWVAIDGARLKRLTRRVKKVGRRRGREG